MRKHGFSLPELLVYVAVLSVFMVGLYSTFSLALTYYHNTRARSDAFGSAKIATALIERLLANGAGSTVRVSPTLGNTPGVYCIFVSGQTDFDAAHPLGEFSSDTSGSVLWQKFICIYSAVTANGTELRMARQALTPTATPPVPDLAKLTALVGLPSRVVARDVLLTDAGSPVTFFSTQATSDDNNTTKVLVRFQITTRVKPSVGSRNAGDNLVGITVPGQILLDN